MQHDQRKKEFREYLDAEATRLGLDPRPLAGFFDTVAHEAATSEETAAWLEQCYGVRDAIDDPNAVQLGDDDTSKEKP